MSSYFLHNIIIIIIIIISLIKNNDSTPFIQYKDDVAGTKYEEYVIEHEIPGSQAKNNAISANINDLLIPSGCHACTKEELNYCMSSQLINDHCCCDKRYHEFFPFIPHTCYMGTKLCSTQAGNCNDYARLRSCCCDKYLLQKWKEKYGNGANSIIIATNFIISLMSLIIILL